MYSLRVICWAGVSFQRLREGKKPRRHCNILQVLNPANYLSWGRDALTQTFQTHMGKILLFNSSTIAVTDAVLLPGQLIVPSSQELLMRIEAVARPPAGNVHMVRQSWLCETANSQFSPSLSSLSLLREG